jgi:hypothetical protein
MDLQVQEHCTGARGDYSNSSFGVGVLMVRANTGKGLGLLVRAKCFSPGLASEDAVVTVEVLNVDSALGGFGLERTFAGQSIVAA